MTFGLADKISPSVKIPRDLHVDLQVAAEQEGRDMGEVVEEALKAYLLKHYFKKSHH